MENEFEQNSRPAAFIDTYYEDNDETDSKTNPEAYQGRKSTVKKGDIINATMVAGGGHCIWIRPDETKNI